MRVRGTVSVPDLLAPHFTDLMLFGGCGGLAWSPINAHSQGPVVDCVYASAGPGKYMSALCASFSSHLLVLHIQFC